MLLGSTGMLGQAIEKRFTQDEIEVVTIARSNSTYELDLFTNAEYLTDIIKGENPDVVINSAAIVNLKYCQENPGMAYILNAKVPGIIGNICRKDNCYFVQISTDHYYVNDKKKLHHEEDEIILINEYARTKYAGECFAMLNNKSLVIRTNIVGFRNKRENPTFIEWLINSLQKDEIITGFDDYYTSSIDVTHFAEILIQLIRKNTTGVVNIAAADVLSKYEFIYEFSKRLGKERNVLKGYLNQFQEINRANSLGLDTTKLRNLLPEYRIPTSYQVIDKLVEEYKEGVCYEI